MLAAGGPVPVVALLAALISAACGGSTDVEPRSYAGEWITGDTVPGYRDIRVRVSPEVSSVSSNWSAVAIRETGSPTKSGEALVELRGDSVMIRLNGFGHTFRGVPVRADSIQGALVTGGGVSTAVILYPTTPFRSEFGFRRITP
jgi:hypothetical protein